MSVRIHDYIQPSSNGREATQTSLPKSAHSPSTWERFRHILPHREDLVVAGREVKGGIVIHPVIATAILGAIVAIGLSIRSEMNWQHDQLVTIAAQKVEADKATVKAEQQLALRLQNIDAVQIVLGRDITKLQEAQKAKGRN